jgi:3-oxoacyl-[acyl-carrier-protein] synthase-3
VTVTRSIVRGVGAYLPAQVMTNADLARTVDTSDEWIVQRTGIRERRIAAKDEMTSDLAIAAARAALAHAGMTADAIDLIVLATSTPDQTFPASAVTVQAELGITRGAAFDLQAVCSGFVFALATADRFLRDGEFRCALVIGAETFSRILDWKDRGTCVLFGDGAGAVVLEASEQPGSRDDRGVLTTRFRWPLSLETLCGRRAVLHRDRRASAHGGARGISLCGRYDHRCSRGCVPGHRI